MKEAADGFSRFMACFTPDIRLCRGECNVKTHVDQVHIEKRHSHRLGLANIRTDRAGRRELERKMDLLI